MSFLFSFFSDLIFSRYLFSFSTCLFSYICCSERRVLMIFSDVPLPLVLLSADVPEVLEVDL